MVLGGQPEHRHGVRSPLREPLRGADGRDRFVEGIGGPGEKSDLLAGDDGDGTRSEPIDILPGRSIRAKEPILIAQYLDKKAACGCVQANFAGRGLDSSLGRRMGIIGSYLLEILEKGRKKLGRIRDVAK